MLPVNAKDEHAYTIEINPQKSAIAHMMDEIILEKSGIVLPLILKEFMDKLKILKAIPMTKL